jgi:hypothetical protein
MFSVTYGALLHAATETLDITAVVPGPTPTGTAGGGGSGSIINATVTLSGFAFPNAKLTLLKDGQVSTTLIANADGTFRILMNNLAFGNYQLSVYADDVLGNSSAPYTVNVAAFSSQPYQFDNIIIPPTITSSGLISEIGKPFYVSGYAPPGSTVTLEVPGVAVLASALADNGGFYRIEGVYSLQPGIAALRTKASYNGISSPYSKPVQMLFYVAGTVPGLPGTTPPPPAQYGICVDYNRDRRVNLIDFSILLFWFGKSNPPATIDCNGDRAVDIKDFSILMYFWTG